MYFRVPFMSSRDIMVQTYIILLNIQNNYIYNIKLYRKDISEPYDFLNFNEGRRKLDLYTHHNDIINLVVSFFLLADKTHPFI